ncbi:MAG: polyprenol monophosphomannose synthase [Bacteroidales bacterium]|nr:polyprenol monophosphomannose synthase [Bacteroidales bacterium]
MSHSSSPVPQPFQDSVAVSPGESLGNARLLISLATYNEAENIAKLIEDIHGFVPQANILVVDDHSPDGTGTIVEALANADPRIQVLHRPGKLGLGTAILTAMRYAIDHNYDYLLNMDADFSHPPRFLPAILAGMEQHDVMIGSRYVPGGGTENWPVLRLAISQTVNSLVRFLFRMPVADASGAYRCYRVSKLREADLAATRSRGYSFQQEVLFRVHQAGAKLGESPIIFENRRAGKSKVNWKEAIRSMSMILWLGVNHFLGCDRQRKRPEHPAQAAGKS